MFGLLYNCFILQEQKSGLKDTVVFLKQKNCPTMGLLTHHAQSLAISQALTKALCFCASENSLTALFGSYPQCYSCNRFREKINWNVDGMYFVLETFLISLVDFCTLSIISDNKGTPCNITVSTCLAFKEKIHD